MIVFDTETTELLKTEMANVDTQPHIIEIAMIKLDDKYKEIGSLEFLLKPRTILNDEEHKNITGLSNADLENCPTFVEVYPQIVNFVLGERRILAHNLPFDLGVLVAELKRINMEHCFPYPPEQVCTVEATAHIKGKRLRLIELYELALKKKLKQDHRAMSDAVALAEIVRKWTL
jgi:DNA polymerase-3 subunit epsilon